MIRLLTKIWIALIPILAYLFWVYVIERIILKKLLQPKKSKEKAGEKIVDGEFKIVGEKSTNETAKSQATSSETTDKNSAENSSTGDFSLHNKHFVFVLYVSLIAMIVSLVIAAL